MADISLNLIKNSWDIFPTYVNVMTKFFLHFTSTAKYKKNDSDNLYLLLSGLSTITHVFKIILRSKNDAIQAVEQTINGIFYYSQCIEQMEEHKMNDYEIDSNLASIFVYKKTIANIFVDSQGLTDSETIKNVEDLISIYKKCAELLIGEKYEMDIPHKLVNLAIDLCKNPTTEHAFQADIKNTIAFINHFPYEHNLYDYISLYLKKYKGTPVTFQTLLKKIHPEYHDKLKYESINGYIKWIFSY
jgi:hypothetical protein